MERPLWRFVPPVSLPLMGSQKQHMWSKMCAQMTPPQNTMSSRFFATSNEGYRMNSKNQKLISFESGFLTATPRRSYKCGWIPRALNSSWQLCHLDGFWCCQGSHWFMLICKGCKIWYAGSKVSWYEFSENGSNASQWICTACFLRACLSAAGLVRMSPQILRVLGRWG